MNAMLTLDQVRRDIYSPVQGPRASLPRSIDVVIVGGGPIGLILGNLLGSYGIETLLLEKNDLTSEMPKAIILDDEHMRLLDSLGLAEPMKEHVVGPVGIDFLSPFGFTLTGSTGVVTANGFAARSCMAQPMFEKILLEGVRRRGSVKVCYGVQLTALKQTEDAVELTVRPEGQQEIDVRAKFVLACDGAHSFIRRTLGLKFPGSNLESPRMVVDLAEFPDQSLNCHYWCNPVRPINSIPAPYGGRRIEIMLNKGEKAEEITQHETVKRLIARYTPYAVEDLKIARAVVYDFSERVADHLSVGRVFLLGDAAHIMPPSGGQGLNTGARDAANLAWKLATVIRGQASRTVLDSYHVERWNHIKAVVAYAVRLGAFANVRSWPRSVLRDLGFAVGRFVPALRRRLTDSNAPKPYYKSGLFLHGNDDAQRYVGRLLPKLDLSGAGSAPCTLDELVGLNFVLVGVNVSGPELERARQHPAWRVLGAKAVGLWTGDIPAPESAGTIPRYSVKEPGQALAIGSERGRILVVRPDRYVAAAATPETFDALSDEYARLLRINTATNVVRDLTAA